jgi:ABC-type transporter Mla subunit MlaD
MYERNAARTELTAIKEVPADAWLQRDIDSISARNIELERYNRELADELRTASDANTKLTGIIDNAAGLAESGRQSIRDIRQSVSGAAGTVNELRDNYNQLANLAVRSEGNYNAIIGELDRGTAAGVSD